MTFVSYGTQVIRRFPLPRDPSEPVMMPARAQIMTALVERGEPVIYALCDSGRPLGVPRHFRVCATDQVIGGACVYIATVTDPLQSIVLHFFEVVS